MQEFKHMETGEFTRKFFKESEDTTNLMAEQASKMKEDGFSLEREIRNIKRKAPCPCNSGKKFKNCCGE